MITGFLITKFNFDWLAREASEYLDDPRCLHKRDVHIKALVVRRPVSTLGFIFGFVAKEKVIEPHACWHTITHKTYCTIHPPHCALETAFVNILLTKNKLLYLTHTHVYTLRFEMHVRRLRTTPRGFQKFHLEGYHSHISFLRIWYQGFELKRFNIDWLTPYASEYW